MFRNEAMMKAVKRIRAFGYKELTFDAFDDAGEHVIGSSIKNPNWLRVQNEIFDFVKNDLGIALDSTVVLLKR